MKIKIQILLLVLSLFAGSLASAQNCEGLYFKKGSSYEHENYDSKNKKQGSNKSTVTNLTTVGSKTEAIVHSESYDAKGKKESEADVKFVCEADKVLIDINALKAGTEMGGNPGMQMEMESSYLEFPSTLAVGQTLKNGEMKMKMKDKDSGQEMAVSKISISNRKVEGKETITTPAGTFECFKISSETSIETTAAGFTLPGMKSKSVMFYNKEVGMVKSESYNSGGKLIGYTLLSKFTK